jgi:hypothetical protein
MEAVETHATFVPVKERHLADRLVPLLGEFSDDDDFSEVAPCTDVFPALLELCKGSDALVQLWRLPNTGRSHLLSTWKQVTTIKVGEYGFYGSDLLKGFYTFEERHLLGYL